MTAKTHREEAQKKAAAEHYQKMHAAGKTDQFKKDMERLQEVKRRREREAAERKAKEDGESRVFFSTSTVGRLAQPSVLRERDGGLMSLFGVGFRIF